MELLLDTHLWLWSSFRPKRLSRTARDLIEGYADSLVVSSITFIEIAIKQNKGKLEFAVDLPEMRRTLLDGGVRELSVRSEHALLLEILPPIHRDPFDRLLLTQAIAGNLTLLTVDESLTGYAPNVRYVG